MVIQKNNHAKTGSIIAIEKAFVHLLQYQEMIVIYPLKQCLTLLRVNIRIKSRASNMNDKLIILLIPKS